MARRQLQEINAGSMADIAFLLLIFFLVTTTMDTSTGLLRMLPPPPEDNQTNDISVNKRNIFEILVNTNDQLLVEEKLVDISELRSMAKEFIKSNPTYPNITDPKNSNYSDFPEFKMENDIPVFGQAYVSKQIISLQNDNGTSYKMYIQVQNELMAAYKELRNELALEKFGKPFNELETKKDASLVIESQYKAIKKLYPMRISEAEPKKIGG